MTAPAKLLPPAQRLAPSKPPNAVLDPARMQDEFSRDVSAMAPSRKTFHCVADETVLVHNFSTIKKWNTTGAATLMIPLSAWDALRRLKKGSSRTNANAREAVRFLERALAEDANGSERYVRLQDSAEQYPNWSEVERSFVANPAAWDGRRETPSSNHGPDTLSESFEQQLATDDKQDFTSQTSSNASETSTWRSELTNASSQPTSLSPAGRQESRKEDKAGHKSNANRGRKRHQATSPLGVPGSIQGVLNCVLWQLNESPEKLPETNSLILLTNDQKVQSWAHQCGLIVNRIGQLDHAIKLEEKDLQNRLKLSRESPGEGTSTAQGSIGREKDVARNGPSGKQEEGDDEENKNENEEEVIVFRGRSSRSSANPKVEPQPPAPPTRNETPADKSSKSLGGPGTSGSKRGSPKAARGSKQSNGRGRGALRPTSTGNSNGPARAKATKEEEVDFKLLSGAPRSAARGRGKLWVG